MVVGKVVGLGFEIISKLDSYFLMTVSEVIHLIVEMGSKLKARSISNAKSVRSSVLLRRPVLVASLLPFHKLFSHAMWDMTLGVWLPYFV